MALWSDPSKILQALQFAARGVQQKRALLLPAVRAVSRLKMVEKENVPPVHAERDLQNGAKAKKVKLDDRFLVKKLSEHAYLPVRGSAGAAGYDLAR